MREAGRPLTVRDKMSTNLVCVMTQDRLADIHTLMTERRVRHLPVLEAGRVVGMVSDRDILVHGQRLDHQLHFPPELKAEDIMTREVLTCRVEAPLEEIAAKMMALKVDALVVTDPLGRLVGVITSTDLLDVVRRGPRPGGDERPRVPLDLDLPESVI